MKIINRHIEWSVFLLGLILMANIDPNSVGKSLCFIEYFGFTYCPGEGLGHSIAHFFRGDIINAFNMHLMGPPVVIGLSFRICSIWFKLIKDKLVLSEEYHGESI